MGARFHSWWWQIKRHRVTILVVTIILIIAIALIIVGYRFDWTGFKGKTLWDWLGLLGILAIPVMVSILTVWFTERQSAISNDYNRMQQAQALQVVREQLREADLKEYLDKMSELLLHEHLRESQPEDEIRSIARVRTLTILSRIDNWRKRSVLQFLHESKLIEKGNRKIDLYDADFTNADLRGVSLIGTDLHGANLHRADLQGAYLTSVGLWNVDLNVDLSEANLTKANLWGAELDDTDLTNANLINASVTPEQLAKAKSLKGATMPDGSKHE
jgi:uncharacterized protein YjbI with pentapeptide repeats